mmetsp:Transcript_10459/g.27825  ORF Transcript_10459/g.27825 Transcript_10459/m.27825 type:complete len:84 (-) Transcript_10459:286-537(-)
MLQSFANTKPAKQLSSYRCIAKESGAQQQISLLKSTRRSQISAQFCTFLPRADLYFSPRPMTPRSWRKVLDRKLVAMGLALLC